MNVRLETSRGETIPVGATCSIGRSRNNQVVLASPRVSRHHALIHRQNQGEYWLVDLGSNNGSLVNRRRIQQPTQLKDGDHLEFAGNEFVFRQEARADEAEDEETDKTQTANEMSNVSCWLLLADIKGFSKLTRELSPSDLAQLMGTWFLKTKEAVESKHGYINKYLGDGFLVYWIDEPAISQQVQQVLRDLTKLQSLPPVFRVVVHFGDVAVGRVAQAGATELLGPDVNFAFRIEKLASQLDISCLLSLRAADAWPERSCLRSIGRHAVAGFDGEHEFFTL